MFRVHVSGEEAVAANLSRLALGVHVKAAAVVATTAARVETTQRDTVRRRSGATAASITTLDGNGRPFTPGDLVAEIGPTDWKAHLIEFGTQRHGPFPFVGPSLDPHRAAFLTGLRAAAS